MNNKTLIICAYNKNELHTCEKEVIIDAGLQGYRKVSKYNY